MDNLYYDLKVETRNGYFFHSAKTIEDVIDIVTYYYPIYLGIQAQTTMFPHYPIWNEEKEIKHENQKTLRR